MKFSAIYNKIVKIKAGNGGDGMVSFMSLKGNEYGGPDGGDGGNGGHVIFRGLKLFITLVNFIFFFVNCRRTFVKIFK